MKTKNRVLALFGIAIVLCSVFLVAVPGIAAEQTTQELRAAEVTKASEDDYVLGVYGNANEDDTIDMRDLTYVKLIFFGKKPETELADAKYDGKINPLDFIQVKLIIVGKEKELTLVDSVDRIVTVKKPVKRIVVLNQGSGEMIQVLNAVDKVVGVSAHVADQVDLPEFSKLPSVGRFHDPDCEAILNLNPDIILTYGFSVAKPESKLPDSIKVIGLDFYNSERMKKLGYILDKKDAVEEFIDWYEGYMDEIKSQTEGLSEDEKPRIYYSRHFRGAPYETYNKHSRVLRDFIEIAGGRNIAADLGPELYGIGVVKVDLEWVIEQNPDIIIVSEWPQVGGGYSSDDPSGMKEVRDSVMNRPELANIAAVKNGRVYVINFDIWAPPSNVFISLAYYAKWFHPDLFEDLDPRAIHQEYLTRFRCIDFNVYEHGVFVYPPLKD